MCKAHFGKFSHILPPNNFFGGTQVIGKKFSRKYVLNEPLYIYHMYPLEIVNAIYGKTYKGIFHNCESLEEICSTVLNIFTAATITLSLFQVHNMLIRILMSMMYNGRPWQ